MKFTILTIFPNSFSYINESILAKSQEKWLIQVEIVNIRDFSNDNHKKVDEVPFWWWQWMLMTCQPLFDAVNNVKQKSKYKKKHVIFVSPWWKTFTQSMAKKYSLLKDIHIIIICWRYEWIDQRVIDELVDEQVSIWNYVLSWWELASMILIDAISRLIPWVLWKEESHEEESFSKKLWWKKEFPHYTRPQNFKWITVPEVLLSGNHKEIEKWKFSKLK